VDGSRLLSKEKRSLRDTEALLVHSAGAQHQEDGVRVARHTRSVNVHEAGFIQFMDTGIWHLAFYNDGRNNEQVSYNTIVIGKFSLKKASLVSNVLWAKLPIESASGMWILSF